MFWKKKDKKDTFQNLNAVDVWISAEKTEEIKKKTEEDKALQQLVEFFALKLPKKGKELNDLVDEMKHKNKDNPGIRYEDAIKLHEEYIKFYSFIYVTSQVLKEELPNLIENLEIFKKNIKKQTLNFKKICDETD